MRIASGINQTIFGLEGNQCVTWRAITTSLLSVPVQKWSRAVEVSWSKGTVHLYWRLFSEAKEEHFLILRLIIAVMSYSIYSALLLPVMAKLLLFFFCFSTEKQNTLTVRARCRDSPEQIGEHFVSSIPLGVLKSKHRESSVDFEAPLSTSKYELITMCKLGSLN